MPLFDSNSIKRMLPTFLRGLVNVAWLRANLVRAQLIHDEFLNIKTLADYKRQFSSQTASLENYLRRKYLDNDIYVENLSNSVDVNFIHWLAESQAPTYVNWLSEAEPPVYVSWLSEYSNETLNYDFVVEFPASFSAREVEIRADVNCLRLASKRWRLDFV